jgi:hypothetical protein
MTLKFAFLFEELCSLVFEDLVLKVAMSHLSSSRGRHYYVRREISKDKGRVTSNGMTFPRLLNNPLIRSKVTEEDINKGKSRI